MAPNDAYVQKFRQAQERVSRKSPAPSSDGTTKRVSIGSADRRERPATKGNIAQSSDWWRTKLINAPDLCDLEFPDLKYVVPGIVPEGVTLLASRPKLGKSWLFLQVGSAVAAGVTALVPSEKPQSEFKPLKSQLDNQRSVDLSDLSDLSHTSTATDSDEAPVREIEL